MSRKARARVKVLRFVGPEHGEGFPLPVEDLEPRIFLSVAHHHRLTAKPTTPLRPAAKPAAAIQAAAKFSAAVAPSGISASATGPEGVQIRWAAAPAATGYNILRSTDGKKFTLLTKLTTGGAGTYTDTSVAANHSYSYQVQAYSGATTSPVSKAVSVTTPLVTPGKLSAVFQTAVGVQLQWTDDDTTAAGYLVLRSADGTHFSQLAKLSSGTTKSYTDAAITSGKVYDYQVQAYSGANTSAASGMAIVTTPMVAPAGLTAAFAGGAVNLKWADKDASATGYLVLRSTDGTNFGQLAQVNGGGANTFADTAVAAGQQYYYQVEARNAVAVSVPSNVASATPTSAGTGATVSVATRYGNELVVTATGAADTVSVSQSGGTITITANGKTVTDPAPAAGLFVYTRGGADTVTIASSVVARTTVASIDGANTVVNSAGANVSLWIDAADTVNGSGTVHAVGAFAGNVTKAPGASLANPTDSGATVKASLPLWGTGPAADDVNQGGIGDCYFLSSLAAFAGTAPAKLNESAVDLGDGTYAVQFYAQSKPVYVRVSNNFAAGAFGGYAFAHPGANATAWAMVMEKAYAWFRSGANTYASLNSGWMGEAYNALGVANTTFNPSNFDDSAFYATVSRALAGGRPVTLAALKAPDVVNNHAYTLVSASTDAEGSNRYKVRNPWGTSGDALEDPHGYATLTFTQLAANFAAGCQAA